MAQIKIFNTPKILPFLKSFFTLNILRSTLGKKDLALIFFVSNYPWLLLKYQHFYKLLGQIIFRIFCSQCHNSLVFAAPQIANNLSSVAKKL